MSKRLLIESHIDADTIQKLLLFGEIISSAWNYEIVIANNLKRTVQTGDFAHLYLEKFKIVNEKDISKFQTFYFLLLAIYKRVTVFFSKRKLLQLRIDGLQVGHIVYDVHIGNYPRGSVLLSDWRIVKTIYHVIKQIRICRGLIKDADPHAMLLSHRIGLPGGIFALIAEERKIPILNFGGNNLVSLDCKSDPFGHLYKPNSEDIDKLISIDDEMLEKYFNNARTEHLGYLVSKDTELAFGGEEIRSRSVFFKKFSANDNGNPIIFVLAHVPNDYPNALGTNPLFCDYHEWLCATIAIIGKNTNINWVIKEHPSMSNYGFDKKYFDKLMNRNIFNNIFFIRSDDNFSVTSLRHLASCIVTFKGSAGFEMPALYEIPSIYWVDSLYTSFKIGTEVVDLNSYDQLLLGLNEFELNKLYIDVRMARLFYAFTYYLSRVRFEISPLISQKDMLNNDAKLRMLVVHQYYLDNIDKIRIQRDVILEQLKTRSFKALRAYD